MSLEASEAMTSWILHSLTSFYLYLTSQIVLQPLVLMNQFNPW
jgi:succinate dehydrogenase/fumarate reductase cytochrome b subunit